MRRIVLAVLAAAAAALVPGTARAATAIFAVTATVNKTCTISAPGTVAFGSFDPTLLTKTVTADLTVVCTKGASYSIVLASQNAWAMKSTAGDLVPYVIYQPDSSGAATTGTLWNASGAYANTSGGRAAKALTMTAVVTPSDVPAGDYTDTVTATINF